jgi:hypothetical protein
MLTSQTELKGMKPLFSNPLVLLTPSSPLLAYLFPVPFFLHPFRCHSSCTAGDADACARMAVAAL